MDPIGEISLATIQTNSSQEIDSISNAFTTSVVGGEKAAVNEATTTFVTDANVVATTVSNPMYTPRSLYMSSSDNYMQEIKTFLQKPQIVAQGTLNSTDTVSSFTSLAASFPQFFGTIPLWREKTQGYFGIRFDLSFRLVVNATRFQQGRYILLWKPFGGATADTAKNSAIMAGHVMTLVQRTQMPHSEIDINCDTEINMLIPFSNVYNYCDIRSIQSSTDFNSIGEIQIYPYVALNAVTGALTANFTLYVSAVNVELISAAAPQMAPITSRKGRNETSVEQADANMGPISSIMKKVSAASSILTGVPLISSYSSSVGWLADILGNTAAVFGYSKPINLEHANRMTKEIFPYIANTDGPDNSFPFALSYKNEIAQMSGVSPTDLDEMDFSFLCTIPTFSKVVSWSTAPASGAALTSLGVGPTGSTALTTTVNTALLVHYPPFEFLARHFKFWRGTMVYKFKIVKTEFHSGRLSFSYSPSTVTQIGASTPTYANLPYIHREIVDIRLDNEVIFSVPYVSSTPYKPVLPESPDDSHVTGIFAIHVVDPLVAPDTVSQKVDIIVEISMGPDAEFSVPIGFTTRVPFYGAAPQMGVFDNVGNPETNVCNEESGSIGAMVSSDDLIINSLHCIGEKISSVRKYIRRPSPWIKYLALVPTELLLVTPFGLPMATQNGITNTVPAVLPDVYASFASLYLYSRGSVRLKFVSPDAIQSSVGPTAGTIGYFRPKWLYKMNVNLSNPTTIQSFISAITPYSAEDSTQLNMILSTAENNELQIPHYHRFPLRNKFDHSMNSQYAYSQHTGLSTGTATEVHIFRSLTELTVPAQDSIPCRVYRGTADDCNFSYFLSVPPMTIYNGN